MKINNILRLVFSILLGSAFTASSYENDWSDAVSRDRFSEVSVPDSVAPTAVETPADEEADDIYPGGWPVYSRAQAAQWLESYYSHSGEVAGANDIEALVKKNSILGFAEKYEGAPYGRGSGRVDCSLLVKLTLMKYSEANQLYETAYDFPNSAADQYAAAAVGTHRMSTIPMEQLRPGDLVFFASGDRITHVGFYAGPASGGRVGLFHAAGKKYTAGYSAVPKDMVYDCARFKAAPPQKAKTSSL